MRRLAIGLIGATSLALGLYGWGSATAPAPSGARAKNMPVRPSKPQNMCVAVGKSKNIIVETIKTTPYYDDFQVFYKQNIKKFEGVPYGAGMVPAGPGVTLVNVEQMDCVTFIEHFVGLALTRREMRFYPERYNTNEDIFNLFVKKLNLVRYYGGVNCTWDDRINYFTDGLNHLKSYKLVKNVAEINGEPFNKKINYMSLNKNKFAGIENWEKVRKKEAEMTRARPHYYPLETIDRYRAVAKTGDIVALATSVEGLDVSHCGFIEAEDGEVFLTHASSVKKFLVVKQNLCDYLEKRTTITGIFVFRPTF